MLEGVGNKTRVRASWNKNNIKIRRKTEFKEKKKMRRKDKRRASPRSMAFLTSELSDRGQSGPRCEK